MAVSSKLVLGDKMPYYHPLAFKGFAAVICGELGAITGMTLGNMFDTLYTKKSGRLPRKIK